MRIVLLANNWVGWQLAEWLAYQDDIEIVGLVLHPEAKRKYGGEILAATKLPNEKIFDATTLRQPEVLHQIKQLKADVALSFYFGYILKSSFLDLFPNGVLNLHPSFLPYNRGAYPNIWSIIDGTPAGVTLHYIDEQIDTGHIISQRLVTVEITDTGKTLYEKLERASVSLFCEVWPRIALGDILPIAQEGIGSSYRMADVAKIDEIELSKSYLAKDLLNILRARTFPPFRGAYFWHEGRKIYIHVQLFSEDDET